jgi:predicted metalloprotease with PDZ domain
MLNFRKLLLLLFISCLMCLSVYSQQTVRYEVSFPNAIHHEVRIKAHFTALPNEVLEVRMARSSPGRYALHEFAKNVYELTAINGAGEALSIYRPNPYAWHIAGHEGEVVVEYTLFADRIDGTYASVNERQAHLNIPAAFIYSDQLQFRPVEVHFQLDDQSDWKVATQLKQLDERTFYAPDLYYFMDSPVMLGNFSERSWTSSSNQKDYEIRMVLNHEGSEQELEAFAEWTKRIVEEQKAVFGELPDFEYGRYTFLVNYLPEASGDGMEHRNSTIVTGPRPLSTSAARNIGTISHEFFHAWNVERIRPASLEPFNFSEANMSGELWFAEGFTSYYTDLSLVRAGIITEEEYMQSLARTLNYVLLFPGSKLFSPVEMSYQAPFVDAAVSIEPVNRSNTFISYYSFGELLGLALDLRLRSGFEGLSLDGFMRHVWQQFGKPEIPYTVRDIEHALAEYSGDQAFAAEFFSRHIEGIELPDLKALLAKAGLDLSPQAAKQASLGMAQWQEKSGQLLLNSYVFRGTPLYEAGLEKGDVLLTVADQPVGTKAALDQLMASLRPDETVQLRFMRHGREREVSVQLAANPSLSIQLADGAGREAEALRKAWLNSQAAKAKEKGRTRKAGKSK